ncbi:MAG: hypothetical protein ACXABY_13245, partial [Candidatus Thorarchaeota archaeon]
MRVLEIQKRELFKKKAKFFYDRAKKLYDLESMKRPGKLLLRMSHAVEYFFGSLSSPITNTKDMVSDGAIPTKDSMGRMYENLVSDLDVTFAEQNAIEENIISSFNYTQVQKDAIDEKLTSVLGLIDVAEQSVVGTDSATVRFFDNFTSKNLLLPDSEQTPHPNGGVAEVDTKAGMVQLNIISEEDIIGDGAIIEEFSVFTTEKKASLPWSKYSRTTTPVEDVKRDIYSGKMYGVIGTGATAEDGIRVDISNVEPGVVSSTSTDDEQTNKRTLTRTDEGAYGELKMIDTEEGQGENIATIWEREFVLLDNERVGPFTDINGDTVINTDEVFIGGQNIGAYRLGTSGFQIKRLPLAISDLPGGRSVDGVKIDPQHLRFIWTQIPSNVKHGELKMILEIKLKIPKKASRLSITPHNFGRKVFPKIDSVDLWKVDKVNEDGSKGGWVPVEESKNIKTGIIESANRTLDKIKAWDLGNVLTSALRLVITQT